MSCNFHCHAVRGSELPSIPGERMGEGPWCRLPCLPLCCFVGLGLGVDFGLDPAHHLHIASRYVQLNSTRPGGGLRPQTAPRLLRPYVGLQFGTTAGQTEVTRCLFTALKLYFRPFPIVRATCYFIQCGRRPGYETHPHEQTSRNFHGITLGLREGRVSGP